jgi:hypothetical protein
MFLRPRLLCGHSLISSSIEVTAIRPYPLQPFRVRFKSKKSKKLNQSSNAKPPSPRPAAAAISATSATPRPIQPTPPARPIAEVYEKLTPVGEFIADISDWRYSRLLLTIFVNSTAVVIFILWVGEAQHNADIKPPKTQRKLPRKANSCHCQKIRHDSLRQVKNIFWRILP